MNNLLEGLMLGRPLAVWLVGIALALAWLNRGISLTSLVVFAAAVTWPSLLAASFLSQQHDARQAAENFAALCRSQTSEKILRHSEPVGEIFVDSGLDPPGTRLLAGYRDEIAGRLPLEQPGYREVHVVTHESARDPGTYVVRRRGARTEFQTTRRRVDDGLARYGVGFEWDADPSSAFVRGFSVRVRDRQTGDLLAEQKSFYYHSIDIGLPAYPLWRNQERVCPLSHPADFARSVLTPTGT